MTSLVKHVRCPESRQFLSDVLAEPEMQLLLFTPDARSTVSLPIQQLQQAACTAIAWCSLAHAQRDVLFVATVLQGLHMRLPRLVHGDAAVADVMFTLVMPALHRLDDVAPAQASVLRHLLGWGNQDEVDVHFVPQMLHAMQRALHEKRVKQTVLAVPRGSAHPQAH